MMFAPGTSKEKIAAAKKAFDESQKNAYKRINVVNPRFQKGANNYGDWSPVPAEKRNDKPPVRKPVPKKPTRVPPMGRARMGMAKGGMTNKKGK